MKSVDDLKKRITDCQVKWARQQSQVEWAADILKQTYGTTKLSEIKDLHARALELNEKKNKLAVFGHQLANAMLNDIEQGKKVSESHKQRAKEVLEKWEHLQ